MHWVKPSFDEVRMDAEARGYPSWVEQDPEEVRALAPEDAAPPSDVLAVQTDG